MKVLVTGANGFVGCAVWRRLNSMSGVHVVGCVRRADAFSNTRAAVVTVGDLSAQTDWSVALPGADVVVHAAARVHVMREKITLLPFLLEPVAFDQSAFQPDGLHPTAAAQPKILDHLWNALKPLLV